LRTAPVDSRVGSPENQGRGNQQSATGVSQPPREPNGKVPSPLGRIGERQTDYAPGGAHRGAEERCQEGKLENIRGPLENSSAIGKSLDEPDGDQGFERVSQGNSQGRRERRWIKGRGFQELYQVYDEGAQENTRPEAISKNQQRGEADARGRPYGGGAG